MVKKMKINNREQLPDTLLVWLLQYGSLALFETGLPPLHLNRTKLVNATIHTVSKNLMRVPFSSFLYSLLFLALGLLSSPL